MKKNLTKLAISILTLISVVFFVGCGSGGTGGGCDCGGVGPSGGKSIVGNFERTYHPGFTRIEFYPNNYGKYIEGWRDEEDEEMYIEEIDFRWVVKDGGVLISSEHGDIDGSVFAFNGGDVLVIWADVLLRVPN